jgi:hypothetical protein
VTPSLPIVPTSADAPPRIIDITEQTPLSGKYTASIGAPPFERLSL